ncbi:Fur family transcriptional regulator [Secundilactobacillus kimchicus]|uniref:Peroxide operon transcriptional regulator n=1 Tax=Secundilactobacillus kimchicus JCM 15530 TaxID=1302272 RepID=A0A0R1HQI4_9LACO|nr:Fur family transcriptional regulator [Secundilactobacillus kimchicus]KRK48710.1 peroxide operon transcriptional regulator [Secundilactobacillus kimchicus JCM 15530]MBT9672071.1 transcriptional repressor [Secundilactobacillus kimchicus]
MAETTIDEAVGELRKYHIRVTPQRKLILNYLLTHENHPPVETIYQELAPEMPTLSLATVYNTLNLFVELGLVIEIPNENGGIRYDYFGKPHYHAICENCGKVTDIYSPLFPQIEASLKSEAERLTDYKIDSSHVTVYGLCADCQRRLADH